MARATPPRPVDVEALFPEVVAYRREATRPHPRPGEPDHPLQLGRRPAALARPRVNKDAPVSRSVQRTGVIRSYAILGGLHHHYSPI
jgi:hypothetical protein